MKILYAAFVVALVTLNLNCQKELDYSLSGNGNNNNNNNPNSSFKGTLQGNIVDENGRPAIGVNIHAGSKTAVTDARGYFRIVDAPLMKTGSLVSAEKAGYFKAYRTFSATSGVNQVQIKLIPKKLAGRISAGSGGMATLTNGTMITLPANGVVSAGGSQSYTGDINVYSSYIDPTATDIASILPGSFLGRDKDNKEVLLESYGMLAVELESTSGEKLQIASGKTATLTMPIPTSLQSSAPATIPLWYVDEQTGIWKEEGTAVKNGTNYKGEVKHFTYWNCDVPGPTVNLSAIFKTSQGLPLVQAEICIKPVNGPGGAAHGYTDSLGQISGPVPANTLLTVQIIDPCRNVLYSQNVGPFSSATNLGTITASGAGMSSVITLKGKLLNCSNSAVTNGYAMIYYDNTVRYASVNSSGDFAVTFTRCQASPVTCEILGVDKSAQQQGATVNVPVTTLITDAGNIRACGSSTLEFMNYTLDGTAVSITNELSDSLYAYIGNSTVPPISVNIGANSGNDQIGIKFSHDLSVGVYPLTFLSIGNSGNVNRILPFNVTLTACPQASGQFYEGNFSGQFNYTQTPSVTHTISCSFRVRRS